MIPVLYNEEEMEFITQGLGALSDAISCKVVEELNGSYELTMQYPVTGLHFSDIILNRLILADHVPSRQSEPFQIYKISKPINGIVTIYAEHISYRLSYVPVSPFTANTCVEALNGLKEHADEPFQFTLYTDKSTIAEYKQIIPHSFRELLGGVEGSILDTYRGEYEFNRFNIRFTQHRGVYKESAYIRYGKNLIDLKQEESIENTVTGIYPYWLGTKIITSTASDGETFSKTEDVVVTLPEKIIYSDKKDKYSYHRTIPKDFAYKFRDKPTETQLRAAAQAYVQEIGVPEVNLTVSFLSLASMEENKHFSEETVYLGDTVPIEFIKLGIMTDAEIIKATYDTLMDRYDTLELGTTSSSLSKTIVAMQKKYESAVQKSQLDQVINEQQLKISGGLGGNVVTTYSNNEPSETVYGDTNDVKTMLNCMRVNKSGIAFSNNGYSGPYNSAWTIDGKFNADFIQAGHINGNLITGNTIKAGALDKSITDDIANSKEKLINLQDQVDGLIETWSGADKPTLLNYPAVDWNEKEKKNHIGDLYYDANNKCYRFMQNDDRTFTWKLLADTDVTKAIADATKALDATNNSIAGVTTEWYASESPTELYGGTWSEEKPEWNENNYIWSRSKAVTLAGVISYSQPSCVQGNTGAKGDRGETGATGPTGAPGSPGKDGTSVTITSQAITYQASSSGTTVPTGTWVANPPSVAKGQYLWTRTVVNYSDGKKTTAYSVGYQGTNGQNGQNGSPGRGVKSTEVTYQIWANGTSTPNGTWVTSVPDTTAEKPYLWTRTVITYTDNTKSTSYSVGSTLKGVNVGGRNLILKSKDLSSFLNESSANVQFSSGVFKRLNAKDGSAYGIYYFYTPVLQNTVYTASVNIKNINGTIGFGIGGNEGWRDIIQTSFTTNGVHTLTFKTTSSHSKIRFYVFSTHVNTTCTLSEAKLELGNVATDWTPAPEDVDADINSANNAASVAQDTANKAMNNAIQAQGTSTDAFNKANQAQSSANAASDKAETAITSSKEAQSLATQAQSLANKANSDAYNAMEAIKAQNQVFYADSTGAHIRKAGTNNETRVVADGVEIIADNTKVAEFTKTQGRVSNLVADKFLYVGAHRLEKLTQDGEVGTGFFWTGGAL